MGVERQLMRKITAVTSVVAILLCSIVAHAALEGASFHVSAKGDDSSAGTLDKPFATIQRALIAAREVRKDVPMAVAIYLSDGTHYLDKTLVLTAEDSGTEATPLVIKSVEGAKPVISGGAKLSLQWESHEGNIWKAAVPSSLSFDQLFINGIRQHMARYPNFDPNVAHFNGYSPDAFSPERAARWADPAGGYMHAMHRHMWGDFHYIITGKDTDAKLQYEGGWQNNRRMGMHDKYRMVENIFEELDAPGEWYLDSSEHILYFNPPAEVDLQNAIIEVVRLMHLVELRGSQQTPVKWVTFQGLTFRHAKRTFMDNKEPLLRSDWTTYRGGAVYINGAEDCSIEDCEFDQVGGNAVFVNKYNRRIAVRSCHIHHAGANGVAFVGDPNAVQSSLFEYGQRHAYEEIEKEPGPKTENYPRDCIVEDCLIYLSGRVEKQTAAVQVSMSRGITVRHCSIYDMPRAGINISEGTWGGHIIEYCDIFDTVKETGDHGSFNSWGRDRFWRLKDLDLNDDAVWAEHKNLPLLDVVDQVVIRNNRWRCDHGWDIDLDDGSSNYHLYNNLCLNGGIKNREGFYRIVENNIIVNNGFHPHVWYKHSQDIVRRNIFFIARYRPAGGMPDTAWGKEMDFNLVHKVSADATAATGLQEQSKRDEHSIIADAGFLNPSEGDYRVSDDSPALILGFKNFPMDQFGVVKPELRKIARIPKLPGEISAAVGTPERNGSILKWCGADIRNVAGLGDRSAYGLEDESGVIVLDVATGSIAVVSGLQKGDVIIGFNGEKLLSVAQLMQKTDLIEKGGSAKIEIMRGQDRKTIEIRPASSLATPSKDDRQKNAAGFSPKIYGLCMEIFDAKKRTFTEQAQMLRDLGFDGVGYPLWLDGQLDQNLKTLDKAGLKVYMLYTRINLDPNSEPYDPQLEDELRKLKDRPVTISVLLTGLPPADPRGDEPAIKVLRRLGDLAAQLNLRISIYHHTGDWAESFIHALEVVKHTNHPNVGVNFNLCHWLMFDGEKDFHPILRENAEKIFAVTINGAKVVAKTWENGLIQALDKGDFDNLDLLATLRDVGYRGPIGLMCYGIAGDAREHLQRSMNLWQTWQARWSEE